MKKTIVYLLGLLLFTAIFPSCDSEKTIQEYMKEQQKAIDKFISRNNFKVTESFPGEGNFKENEYFQLTTTYGHIYMHVSSPGNGIKVEEWNRVNVRFDYCYDIQGYVSGKDTTQYVSPSITNYFNYANYVDSDSDLTCKGWFYALDYVTEGAVVDFIIPSKMGAESDHVYGNYVARFYKNFTYTSFW